MLRNRLLPLGAAAVGVMVVTPVHAAPVPDQQPVVQVADQNTITVRVRNEFRRQVTVELVTESGRTVDLGPVEAGSSLVATIANSVLDGTEPVRLRVMSSQTSRSHLSDPLVSDDTVRSKLFAALPGAMIEMHIGQELSASRVWVEAG